MKTLESLRDGLYHAAKANMDRKFYSLHDKMCRSDVLMKAWAIVSSNGGAPGIDQETVEDIEKRGVKEFLSGLKKELENETYRVPKIRRVFIPKDNKKLRPLGIPTVRDRIVQQAVKLIIEPIFEADFKDCSYAYRPGRSAIDASEEIRQHINHGLTNIIDIDISGFFDHIDHESMIFFVTKRIADPYVIKLMREWLRAGIVFQGNTSYPEEGTPQGGVISPLLANIYLNELDTVWKKKGMGSPNGRNAHLVRYADDCLVLTNRGSQKIADTFEHIISALGLEINREKSRITTAYDGFDFLGFHFVMKRSFVSGNMFAMAYPSDRSVRRFREKVKALTSIHLTYLKSDDEMIRGMNSLIRGWSNYFNHTNAAIQYATLQMFVDWKVSKFYCHKHKIPRVSGNTEHKGIGRKLGLLRLGGRTSYYRPNAAR